MYTNNTAFCNQYVASILTVVQVQSLAITTARQSVSSYTV